MTSYYSIDIPSINKKYYYSLDTTTNLITGIYDYNNIGNNIIGQNGFLPLPNSQYAPNYFSTGLTNFSFNGSNFTGLGLNIITGNPLDSPYYNFYNTGLIDVPNNTNVLWNPYTSQTISTNLIIKLISGPPVCFNHDTKILTDKGYIPIQHLRKGNLIKTLKNGYKPIHMICNRDFYNPSMEERISSQLYLCSNKNYPGVFEDLIITGAHSILVDKITDTQRCDINNDFCKIYVTDDKYRLPAYIDDITEIYSKKGPHTIYHIALENDNYYMNYGIYANGLLVETCSKRYLSELSDMKIIC